jgi:hypothetical protein
MAGKTKTILDIVKAVDKKEFFEDVVSAKRSPKKIEPAVTRMIPETEFIKKADLKKREIDIAKRQILRGKEWQRDYEYQEKDRIDPERIEKIRFNIEDLLSPENLMNPDSVGVLQDLLNKYVYGERRLKVDKQLGLQTTESIRQFQNESRYWGGHGAIDINPERTYRRYQSIDREDLREGGGDQGRY